MQMEKIKEFAKKQGYETAKPLKPWNGYECYEPVMDSKETAMTGPPLLILVKGESIRMSTVEEAFQQIDDTEEETVTAKSFRDLYEERSES